MENSPKTSGLPPHDHTTQWIYLSDHVRSRLQEILASAAGTSIESELRQLSVDVARICDHVERIHSDAKRMLSELDEKPPELDQIPADLDAEEVQREAIQIQRETHELRGDFKDIVKALFMWRDDPEERVREKH